MDLAKREFAQQNQPYFKVNNLNSISKGGVDAARECLEID
jgi:hypothetical protein